MTDASLIQRAPVVVTGGMKLTAALLILQFATMWSAFFILAPAINWPASLDAPPGEILPLILDRSGAVFAGYLSYLIHALLLIPIAMLLRGALGLTGAFATVAITVSVLAGFAKALGITRWLFLMPGLAEAWVRFVRHLVCGQPHKPDRRSRGCRSWGTGLAWPDEPWSAAGFRKQLVPALP